jgi:COP9 signalosome complex subunit 3
MTLPRRHLSGAVVRFLKQPMAGYDNVVRAFLQNDRAALEATIVAEQETLAQEQNVGLAHRVLTSLTRHRLKRLAATFISLSLSEIARRVELPDVASAEKEVLKLASAGDITARIDTATGFVRFEADSATSAATPATDALLNPASGRLLETCLRQTVELSEKLREMQRGTVTSHRYLVKNTTAAAGVRGFGQGGSVTVGPEGMMGMGMGVNSSMYDRMVGDF